MGNLNVWDQRYQQIKQLWSLNPDSKLMQYFNLVELGDVLDLGIGEGRNSLPFAMNGFYIDGVDISETAINRCKENFNLENLAANLTITDLRHFIIEKNKYTLIIAANVLNFFRKADINELIEKIKLGIRDGGIIYLSAFSTLDPTYKFLKENQREFEENTFYSDQRNSYTYFFTKEELLNYFSDFELISCCEGLEYDNEQNNPHYHGIIEFLVRRK
jgi:2-polyprenyl-3-methyl-5-hydroxy-6-metoxy-1,4-benzoquinol methylase